MATIPSETTPTGGIGDYLPSAPEVTTERAGVTGVTPAAETPAPSDQPVVPSDQGISPTASPAEGPGDGGQPSASTLMELLSTSDLRDNPSISRYTTVEALAQAYLNSEAKLGERGVTIPTDDAAPETWSEFWKQIPGYPEAPEGYGITEEVLQRILPTGALAPGAEHLQELQQICHDEGFTVRQISKVFEWYGGWMGVAVEQAMTQRNQQGANQLAELEKVWGLNTPQNMAIAQEFIKRRFGDDTGFLEAMIGTGENGDGTILSMSPQIAMMCYELGMATGTDKFVQFAGNGAMSPEQAQAKIDEARTQRQAGAINDDDLGRIITQYGPLASQGRGQGPGAIGTMPDPLQEYTV